MISFKNPIGSVTISGHKFLGCPMSCGVQIIRKSPNSRETISSCTMRRYLHFVANYTKTWTQMDAIYFNEKKIAREFMGFNISLPSREDNYSLDKKLESQQ